MRAAIACVLMATCLQANASFPDQSTVQEFYEESSSVIYAQFMSGELIVRDGHSCGVKYRINAIRGFKGKVRGTIDVMDGPGILHPEIGGKYLLFLSERNGRDLSKEVFYQGMPEGWLKACSTREREIFQTLRIEEDWHSGEPSFIVPERIVVFPRSVPTSPMPRESDHERLLEPARITSQAVFSYLERLRDR